MKPSKMMKLFVELLKTTPLNQDSVLGVTLMLQKSEEAMKELGMLIIDGKITTQEEIIMKAMEIHDKLPIEFQTAE